MKCLLRCWQKPAPPGVHLCGESVYAVQGWILPQGCRVGLTGSGCLSSTRTIRSVHLGLLQTSCGLLAMDTPVLCEDPSSVKSARLSRVQSYTVTPHSVLQSAVLPTRQVGWECVSVFRWIFTDHNVAGWINHNICGYMLSQ